MNDINEQLYEMYYEYWGGLRTSLKDYNTADLKISYPLLLNVFPEYLKSKIKILFIGQQTNGWGYGGNNYFDISKNEDIIRDLMDGYKNFHLGEKWINSPFWYATNFIYKELNPNCGGYGYLWSNIVKVDQDGYRPNTNIENLVANSFPVLPKEIEILKPDVVIFFTGSNYEQRLRDTFPNLVCEPIKQNPDMMLSKIRHPWLPENTFRTYHPKYLRLSGKSRVIDEIIAAIKYSID